MKEEKSMTRAERLGLTDEDYQLASTVRNIEEAITDPNFLRPDNALGQLNRLMFESPLAAVGCALEDDLESARRHAETSVQQTLEFFFGRWRSVPQAGTQFRGESQLRLLPYAGEYLRAVRMAGLVQDWESARRLSEYPNRKLCREFEGDTLEQNAYVYLLCSFILGDFHIEQENRDVVFVRSRRNKQYKLLVQLAMDVSKRDDEAFNRDLREYLQYFKKRQFREDIPRMLSQDGTFWINCARHCGMSPQWQSEYDDFLVFL